MRRSCLDEIQRDLSGTLSTSISSLTLTLLNNLNLKKKRKDFSKRSKLLNVRKSKSQTYVTGFTRVRDILQSF